MNKNHTYNECASCHTENLTETCRLTDSNGVDHDFCPACAGDIWHLAEEFTPFETYEKAVSLRVDESVHMAKEHLRLQAEKKDRSALQQLFGWMMRKVPSHQ